MVTRASLFFLASCPLLAQFSQFATTDDGAQVYFTSTLTLAGAPPSFGDPGVFRADGNGVQAVASSMLALTQRGAGATHPQISGDGKTIGVTRDGNGELLGKGAAVLGPGVLTLSRNALWAVLTVTSSAPPPINSLTAQSTVINLTTGERTGFPPGISGINFISSDGTAIIPGPTGGFALWRRGLATPLSLPDGSSIVGLSDNGQVLLYEQVVISASSGPQQLLVARDLRAGNEISIVFGDPPFPANSILAKGLSNDGQSVLYLILRSNGGKVFVANTVSGQSLALLLPNGELATDGTLSGDGNLAYLTTTSGRIIRIDVHGDSNVTVVAPPAWVPSVGIVPSLLFPGSLVHLTGKNLPPSGDAVSGRIFIDNIALPIVYANAAEVAVQVPWELQPPGPSAFRVDLGDSPFRQNQWVAITPMFPQFAPLGPGETSVLGFKAIRSDFSGLLTTQPAPGDVIVIYATGLGPVNGPMVTGEYASANSAISIQGQISCSFYPYQTPAETLFAGLAPGLLGVYQINFRIPFGDYPGPITGGFCTYSGAGRNGGFSWYVPDPPK